jgi:predicted metal-dependent HD superfamily phosphohydrolase
MSYPYFDRAFGTIVKTSRAPHEKFKQEELNALLVMGIRYGEKHRRWHTLAHMEKTVEIAQMLGGNEATLWDAMMHDIVYSPGETNNEENSLIMAAFFYEAMQLDIGWSKERSGILPQKHIKATIPKCRCSSTPTCTFCRLR